MSEESLNTSQNVFSKVNSNFKPVLIKEILKMNVTNPKTKFSDETVDLMSKIAKVMVIETSMRAAKQAKTENKFNVNLDHVEAVLPQIILDFP